MGYKKTIHRDEISGLHVHQDVADGTHSVNELRARSDARQQAINDAIKGDWPENMTATSDNIEHPTYGNAGSRFSRPSDFVVGSKADRFGSSAEDDTNPATQGGAAQKPAKQKGIEQPKKRS